MIFTVALLLSCALGANDRVIWDELNLVKSDISNGLKLSLEADAFDRLDVNHDNKLSEEEWRHFLESSAVETFKQITVADMLEIKQNLVYPVFKVTEEMNASQINIMCGIALSLEKMDLVQEFEKLFHDKPELLVQAALEHVRTAPVAEKNFVKFDAYLEKLGEEQELFSKELHIPEECKQMTRRRTFGSGSFTDIWKGTAKVGTTALSTTIGVGAAVVHLTEHCTFGDNDQCNTDSSNQAFVTTFHGTQDTFGDAAWASISWMFENGDRDRRRRV